MISKLKELMNKITKAGLLHFVRNDNAHTCHPEQTCHPELVSGSCDLANGNKDKMLKLVQHDSLCKKIAFTLAEVLITLGIIGIVAALTLPGLVKKFQNLILINQLKKEYAVFLLGFKMMQEEEGPLPDILVNEVYADACTNNTLEQVSRCDKFYNMMKKYFKVSAIVDSSELNYKFKQTYTYNGKLDPRRSNFRTHPKTIILQNGAFIIYWYMQDWGPGYDSVSITVDVNGIKKPNELGRDIYGLLITRNKGVQFSGYDLSFNELKTNCLPEERYDDDAAEHRCRKDPICLSKLSKSTYAGKEPIYCGEYLKRNNWKMDY